MYKNRKVNKNLKQTSNQIAPKRNLNVIDENTTIKIAKKTDESVSSQSRRNSCNSNSENEFNVDVFNSEENIPASQEPTQRYLSQRSIAVSLTRTQSRGNTTRPPNTYFEMVLMKSGALLDEGDNFVLSCDHVAFVSKFREILMKSQNYPDNIEMFKTGLSDALTTKPKLTQKLLSGCTINMPGEESVYQSQNSMMVNFLMIDFLCNHVLEILLDKAEKIACGSIKNTTGNNIPLLTLLLAQMRNITLSHGTVINERMHSIFEKANPSTRMEIIASAEFIIEPNKHDEFVQLLLDNIAESKDFFNPVIMQSLIHLNLSPHMQGKIRNKILCYIKENQNQHSLLPVLIQFLLKILNEDNDESVRELVNTLREIVIYLNDISIKGALLDVFSHIEQGLIRSKKFYTLWQKKIGALSPVEFKSIDFVILLLLIYIKEDNSMFIENIIRRRIKLEHITVEIIVDTCDKYGAVLEKLTNILMQILHNFLKEKHKSVANFARASYCILFKMDAAIQKEILKKLLELTYDRSVQNMTNLALELLRDLHREYAADVQNWGMLLLPLLDRLNEMSLSQTRIVMKLLCSIAFPEPGLHECSSLQDQIDMLVKKQLISRVPLIKKQGIIGGVQLIDSIARIEKTYIEMDDLDTTFNTASDLPDGRGKMAANYIERIRSSIMHCPESLALFFDELASICAVGAHDPANKGLLLDKPLVIWLCEVMTYYFQDYFISEDTMDKIGEIQVSLQKCLNTQSAEMEESEVSLIAINISEAVLKPAQRALQSALVLAPLFNFVRVLHFIRYEGSLIQINALLGCAIILPTFFDDVNFESIYKDYDEQTQKKILDIYFHCVNWIRETVSSFSTQHDQLIKNQVLIRLADLIQIEAKVRRLLSICPVDYMPPLCQYITAYRNANSVNKSGGRGKPATNTAKGGRGKSGTRQTETEMTTLNETNANNSIEAETTAHLIAMSKPKTLIIKTNFDVLYNAREVYRQMDSNVMLILNEKLNIKFPLPKECIGKEIGLLEFRFLLTDLVNKVESITGVQQIQTEEHFQYIAKPYAFLSDLSQFLRKIVKNMEMISSSIIHQLDKVSAVYSHPDLFTEGLNYLKVCLGLCLRLLNAYFSWPEFIEPRKSSLLKNSFAAIIGNPTTEPTNLAMEVFKKLLSYEFAVLDLKTALNLYQLVVTIKSLSKPDADSDAIEDMEKAIHNLCRNCLQRKWFNYDGTLEKGATCNIYLNELVKGFLRNCTFSRQKKIVHVISKDLQHLNSKEGTLKEFPNFKKANFPILFRGCCEILLSFLNEAISNSEIDSHDKLKKWEKSCDILNMLLKIVQNLDIPRNSSLFLKYAHLYIKLVLQHGVTVLEDYLRGDTERISEFLKSLQNITRYLHNLCCHSKAKKNSAIVNQIPFLRETVENLVFSIKAILTGHKCASVLNISVLKNKDLDGAEILSQTVSLTSASHGDSDEEIPEDDASVEETILGQNDINETTDDGSSNRTRNRSKSNSRSKCY